MGLSLRDPKVLESAPATNSVPLHMDRRLRLPVKHHTQGVHLSPKVGSAFKSCCRHGRIHLGSKLGYSTSVATLCAANAWTP
jgi:hypothetical protein